MLRGVLVAALLGSSQAFSGLGGVGLLAGRGGGASVGLVSGVDGRSSLGVTCGAASRGGRSAALGLAMSGSEGAGLGDGALGRRGFLGLAGAAGAGLILPGRAGADMAPMGADVLDRPEFRKRQDLVIEPLFVPEDGPLSLPVPINGRNKKLKKVMGDKATIVMNIKLDDPETSRQIPALKTLVAAYADKGLQAICVPTDQGDYEPDDSTTVRIKVAQQFGMQSSSKGPVVVTDKTDVVGKFAHPMIKYLTTNAPTPNNVTRITLNYEKFLIDKDGKVLRRYPRQWGSDLIEKDVVAVLAGKPLPPVNKQWEKAWSEANKETTRSMYSFRKHYNYYDQQEAGKDWEGTKAELFTPGSVEARFKGVSRGKPLNVQAPE